MEQAARQGKATHRLARVDRLQRELLELDESRSESRDDRDGHEPARVPDDVQTSEGGRARALGAEDARELARANAVEAEAADARSRMSGPLTREVAATYVWSGACFVTPSAKSRHDTLSSKR